MPSRLSPLNKKKSSQIRTQTHENNHYSGVQELYDAEEGLQSYTQDIVKKIYKRFNNAKKILDFGAGSGQLAEIWRKKFGVTPDCLEIDPHLIKILVTKKFKVFNDTAAIQELYSFIYTSNTLEHIENDTQALKEIKNKMISGGMLAIYVPALPILFSDLDRSVGHFRRYKKAELINKVVEAGFIVKECFWNDSIGIIASLFLKMFGFKGKVGLGNRKSLIFYDRVIYPVSRILDQVLMRRIIGKNLFLFAVKP
jgi:2-polyprenyl-3-methyl-5-hydroxy-6-metoxy-1,4-benzoquinol methylase